MSTHSASRFQQCTRVPPFPPGCYVKLRDLGRDHPLSGKVRRVLSLTCSITSAEQKAGVWRLHFDGGGFIEWHSVERLATAEEQAVAERRAGR